jgi:uncharacterized membrane protein YeaQ/YmgE (transglycosylase-associated protein family)
MLDIIWQLIVGLIVGVIARFLLPGKEAFPEGALGWLLTALLGVAGAFIGGMIARSLWADAGYTRSDPVALDRPADLRKGKHRRLTLTFFKRKGLAAAGPFFFRQFRSLRDRNHS